jgi:DNA-binding XRE family transcriptional regulator
MHTGLCETDRMPDSPSTRLTKIRRRAGYETALDAAKAIGVNYTTYAQHENGTREISKAKAPRYARFFKVSVDWLLYGRGEYHAATTVPVIGYIGAGQEVFTIDDHPLGEGLEQVSPPPGVTDCVALKIRGTSMFPMEDGWLIFYQRETHGILEECIGKLCVVQIKDGPTLLKKLRPGTKKGFWTLDSWNAPARENVRLEWAARVIDIRPT